MFKRFFLILSVCAFLLTTSCGPFNGLRAGSPSFETLKIAFAEPITNYSPLSYELADRRYLSQIYESLVRFDGTFNIESGLAVSWGRLDETTWDFRLREGVIFHTGKAFTPEDAIYSLNLARESYSELAPLLSSISTIESSGSNRLTITTKTPDPLLLNKLTYVYMVPKDYTNFEIPIGTGPYRIDAYQEEILSLKRFDSYWGPLAYFPNLELHHIPDPEERRKNILNGSIHVLGNLAPQDVSTLKQEGIRIENFPSLELSFLILNEKGIFADPDLRAAVWYALSTDYAESFGGGFLKSSSQYAATGVFGYDNTLPDRSQDLEKALNLRGEEVEELEVTLDIPNGLEALGEAIKRDLEYIKIGVTVNVLSPEALQEKIESGNSDLYFFGWKYDLADSADFFEAVVHSSEGTYGVFNGWSDKDQEMDQWIETAGTELSSWDRLVYLQLISQRLLEEKNIIPLFESEHIFAFRPELRWNLRLDGQLWASEIIENVLE